MTGQQSAPRYIDPPPTGPVKLEGQIPTTAGDPNASTGRRDRIIAVLLAVVCVVVTGIAVEASDKFNDLKAVTTVQVGEPAELNGGTITVTKVEAATELGDGSEYDPKFLTTKGMFLVLTIRYAVPGKESSVGAIGGLPIQAGDMTYNAFGDVKLSVQAGFVGTGTMTYEVDPDHIAGAYIRLQNKEMFYVTSQTVQVDLGIGEANAAQWYRSAKGRTLTPAKFSEKPLP